MDLNNTCVYKKKKKKMMVWPHKQNNGIAQPGRLGSSQYISYNFCDSPAYWSGVVSVRLVSNQILYSCFISHKGKWFSADQELFIKLQWGLSSKMLTRKQQQLSLCLYSPINHLTSTQIDLVFLCVRLFF